jgi:hypothetical protein
MGSYTRTYSFADGTTAYGSQCAFEYDALGSSVNNIVNAQISSGAAIADSKLAQITTPSKVSGAAITLLTSLPSGAGEIPVANLNTATQAEQETGTDITTLVTSGTQKYHPGTCKGWVNFNGTGTIAITQSYNVTSLTDNGVGDYSINWTTSFSAANYAVLVTGKRSAAGGGYGAIQSSTSIATGSVRIETWDNNGASTADHNPVCVAAFGDF